MWNDVAQFAVFTVAIVGGAIVAIGGVPAVSPFWFCVVGLLVSWLIGYSMGTLPGPRVADS